MSTTWEGNGWGDGGAYGCPHPPVDYAQTLLYSLEGLIDLTESALELGEGPGEKGLKFPNFGWGGGSSDLPIHASRLMRGPR